MLRSAAVAGAGLLLARRLGAPSSGIATGLLCAAAGTLASQALRSRRRPAAVEPEAYRAEGLPPAPPAAQDWEVPDTVLEVEETAEATPLSPDEIWELEAKNHADEKVAASPVVPEPEAVAPPEPVTRNPVDESPPGPTAPTQPDPAPEQPRPTTPESVDVPQVTETSAGPPRSAFSSPAPKLRRVDDEPELTERSKSGGSSPIGAQRPFSSGEARNPARGSPLKNSSPGNFRPMHVLANPPAETVPPALAEPTGTGAGKGGAERESPKPVAIPRSESQMAVVDVKESRPRRAKTSGGRRVATGALSVLAVCAVGAVVLAAARPEWIEQARALWSSTTTEIDRRGSPPVPFGPPRPVADPVDAAGDEPVSPPAVRVPDLPELQENFAPAVDPSGAAEAASADLAGSVPPPAAAPQVPDPSAMEPFSVVEAFLAADSVGAMRRFVRDPESVTDRMQTYYAAGGVSPVSYDSIRLELSGTVPDSVSETHLFVVHPTGGEVEEFPVSVEETPDGYKVDWEVFVECKDRLLQRFVEERPATPGEFYVIVKRSHYFGDDFPGAAGLVCLHVASPLPEDTGHYAFVSNEQLARLDFGQPVAWGAIYFPVVQLSWKVSPEGDRYLHIDRVVRNSWRGE